MGSKKSQAMNIMDAETYMYLRSSLQLFGETEDSLQVGIIRYIRVQSSAASMVLDAFEMQNQQL